MGNYKKNVELKILKILNIKLLTLK